MSPFAGGRSTRFAADCRSAAAASSSVKYALLPSATGRSNGVIVAPSHMPCRSGSPQGVRDEVPEVAVAGSRLLQRSRAARSATGTSVSHATAVGTTALDTAPGHDLI